MATVPRARVAAVIVGYLLANVAIWLAADPSCRAVGGECYVAANHWGASIAQALLDHGAVVWLDDPSKPFMTWPPGGGAIEAFTRLVGSSESVALYITTQIAVTLAVGLLVLVLGNSVSGPHVAGMAIFLFNPNVLTLAHLPQGEIYQMFLLALAFACLWRFASNPSAGWALGCGALLGVSSLVRPDTLYLTLVLPIAFPLVAVAAGHGRLFLRAAVQGLAATAVAVAILAPWVAYVARSGEGIRFTERSQEYLYFLDNLRFLSPESPGRLVASVKQRYWQTQDAAFAATVPGWENLSDNERAVFRLDTIKAYYLSGAISPAVMAEALVWSWARILLNPGSSWTRALFTGEDPDFGGSVPVWYQGLAVAFTVVARVLGVLGVLELIRRRRFDVLVILAGLFAYFLMIHLFNGQSRYRVPIEPQLALLSGLGWCWCVHTIRRRSRPSNQAQPAV